MNFMTHAIIKFLVHLSIIKNRICDMLLSVLVVVTILISYYLYYTLEVCAIKIID